MAALGIEPSLVDEETAAAVCGVPIKRFRSECPVPGVRVGHRTLRPLDLVKEWSVRYWAEAAAYPLEGQARAETDRRQAFDNDDWASLLPDAPQATGGRHGVAH